MKGHMHTAHVGQTFPVYISKCLSIILTTYRSPKPLPSHPLPATLADLIHAIFVWRQCGACSLLCGCWFWLFAWESF